MPCLHTVRSPNFSRERTRSWWKKITFDECKSADIFCSVGEGLSQQVVISFSVIDLNDTIFHQQRLAELVCMLSGTAIPPLDVLKGHPEAFPQRRTDCFHLWGFGNCLSSAAS